MDIYIMNTPTDTEHIIKEIVPREWETLCKYSGNIRGEASEDFMEFDVSGVFVDQNYCYIPEFRRFYWITERNMYRANITTLTLKSDPLHSFYAGGEGWTGIQDLDIYVNRCSVAGQDGSQNELQIGYNAYLRDDGTPVLEKRRTTLMIDNNLNFNFDRNEYWLVTVG